MAESNSAEELNMDFEEYSTDVMTGDRDKRMYLYYQLIHSLKKAESVDIIVSFLMESGVKMLLDELENALKRGAKIRILTGNYLGITQPSALYLIKKRLGNRVDLRFFNEKNRSFHPKSYIFHYADCSEISVDMVMFLRPTESPVVFLQQLGRGLRKSRGKEYLNVLDFIGNYEKAGRVRFLLTGKTLSEREQYHPADRTSLPDDCLVDFDMKLIDLFAEMDKKHLTIQNQIRNEYFRVKDLLGKRPSRIELFTYMDDDVYQLAISHSKDNPFKKYLDYLKELDELTTEEELLYQGIGREFIHLIENTNMTKVYKMPVLMAFYNHGNVRMTVSEEQLLASWKEFFSTGTNWKDLDTGITYEKYQAISDKDHVKKILQMPVHFLQESGKGFFVTQDGAALALREDLRDIISMPVFAQQMKDVIEYRTMDYYQRRYREKIQDTI